MADLVIRPATEDESDVIADLVFGEPGQETRRVAAALYGVNDPARLRPLFRALWRAGQNWKHTFVGVADGAIVDIVQCGSSAMRVTPSVAVIALRALGLRVLAAPKAMRLHDRVSPTKPPDAMVISELHVLSTARGKGIGGRLLAFAEHEAARRGLTRVALHTYVTNPARHLYERNGYVAETVATDAAFERRTGVPGNVLFVKDL